MSEAAAENLGQGKAWNASALLQLLYLGGLGVVGLGFILWVLAQWNEGGAGDAADYATGTVTLAMSQEPPQLDSTRSTDQVSIAVLGHVMEGLLRYDQNSQLVGGVARALGNRRHYRHVLAALGRPLEQRRSGYRARLRVRLAQGAGTRQRLGIRLYFLWHRERRSGEPGRTAARSAGRAGCGRPSARSGIRPALPYFDKLTAFCTFNPVHEAFYESTAGAYGAACGQASLQRTVRHRSMDTRRELAS